MIDNSGGGVLFKLHIWPKDGPDLSLQAAEATGDQLDEIARELTALQEDFQDFVKSTVVPNLCHQVTALGAVEGILLVGGNTTTTISDYWMLLDGLLGGHGGVLDLIGERFSFEAKELDVHIYRYYGEEK